MTINKRGLLIAAIGTLLFVAACTKEETTTAEASFDLIQNKILTPRCATAGCHATDKDGLVLTKDVSLNRMVNVAPKNAAALRDGLKIITPFNAEKSFLYHKIHDDAGHHSTDYGKIMPIGSAPLTDNEVEFVKRWINAGAPKTGDIVDKNLLK
jgi:hypothetical protein